MLVPKEGGNSVSYVRFAGGGFSRFRDEASCWLPRFGTGSRPSNTIDVDQSIQAEALPDLPKR